MFPFSSFGFCASFFDEVHILSKIPVICFVKHLSQDLRPILPSFCIVFIHGLFPFLLLDLQVRDAEGNQFSDPSINI